MNKADAQEVFKMIQLIEQNGLGHVLTSSYSSKGNEIDLLKLLEKHGINIKSKTLEDILEIIDSALQITCSGHATFNASSKNITIDSKLNSGHSLPWVSILNEYLHKQGYKTRMVLQNHSQKGEKVHIKIHS